MKEDEETDNEERVNGCVTLSCEFFIDKYDVTKWGKKSDVKCTTETAQHFS